MTSPIALDGTLDGLWVPLITPFDREDRVDENGLRNLASRVLQQGAKGIVALGTTGEPAVLTDAEIERVIGICDEVSRAFDAPMMVGVGTNNTRETISATQRLHTYQSVTAALAVVPYYTRPSGPAIVEHYRMIASASPLPVVAYNVPYRTGRGLNSAELLAIAVIENVAGLKQSVGALDLDTLQTLRDAPDAFTVLAGDDAYVVPTIMMGGRGAISAAAHLHTDQFARMIELALRGDVANAVGLAEQLLPLVVAGFAEPNPAVFKAALHHLDEIATPNLRAPMTRSSTDALEAVLQAMQ